MMAPHPDKIWWTPAEIAEACLPDLPSSSRGVNMLADRNAWQANPEFAQRRKGRGGGWEYHWSLFPLAARKKLLKSAVTEAMPAPQQSRDEIWSWFEGLPKTTQDKAAQRLETLRLVEAFETAGQSRFLAVETVAAQSKPSVRTIWNWIGLVEGVQREDWLAYLAPRNRAAVRNDAKAECSPEFIDQLKGDYLRLSKPSFATAFRRTVRVAKAKGWNILNQRTARRRMDMLVPRVSQVFAREGYEGLARCFPPQVRDRTNMTAMEGVNADCHKIDVFVQWEDGTINRPQIVAFQDIFSGKILSWRVDHTPNKVAVMGAFVDLITDYGIPKHCLFDNGREFANKWLTGGTKTRFRFKVREDDPLGVLPQLGVQIHWARPGHGQAKPVERAFRDLADEVAKDPRFEGAYVGHKPDAKPENYGSRAIPAAEFMRVLNEGMIEHNGRLGRLSETANGRSLDETFAASYATAKIAKATPEQRRWCLMGQEIKTLHGTHGEVKVHGNGYWEDWMAQCAGQKVIVRFDPENLHDKVHVFALDGSHLGDAQCKDKSGFFDLASAQDTARKTARIKRVEKRLLKELNPKSVKEVAAALNTVPAREAEPLAAKVIQGNFGGPNLPKPSAVAPTPDIQPEEASERQKALIAKFKAKRDAPVEQEETAKQRFGRAKEIEARSAAGERVGEEEARWLRGYRDTAEYKAQRRIWDRSKRTDAS